MTEQHPLLSWFDSVGIELHPSLHLASDPLTGLSFYTSAPLPSDSVVISVPTRLCITSESAYERIRVLLRHLSGSEVELDRTSLPAPDWVLVYLVLSRLYEEYSAYSASEADSGLREVFEHQPYVHHIPPIIATPLHFSTAELGCLAKTPLHGATQRRLEETIVDYGRAQTLIAPHLAGAAHPFAVYLSSALTCIPAQQLESDPCMSCTHFGPLELWRWAESALTSRSFPPRLIHSTSTTPILIPGYDTFNHARAHRVTWSTSSSAESMVMLTLNSATPAGGQVYNNYGGKSNEEFLSGYGFTLASTREDTLALKLPGENSATHYWRFTADESEKEGKGFVKATCPSPSLLDDLQTHIPQPADQQHELERYASVLETLESLLISKRKAFRQSQALFEAATPSARDEDEEVWNRANANLIRQHVYANVEQYRKGQLELLNHAVKWTRSELESVADALDAEEDE